ncbi:MAG: hypothetical protein ACOY45_09650 [Pseudomonadota bacterium]
MAEVLGEAILVLRTDDRGLDTGMKKAEGGAQGVGMAFDKAGDSAQRLSKDMGTVGDTATNTATKFKASSGAIVAASGAQRAGVNQLIMNIGDMSTMWSMGMRPAQIFASQIGQITQAIQLAAGETSMFAKLLTGPWGMALIFAIQLLGPFIGKLWESKAASEAAAAASDALADKVDDLGTFFDKTTGKIKQTNAALREYAILQATDRIRAQRELQQDARVAGRNALRASQTDASAGLYRPGAPTGLSPVPLGRGSDEITKLFANGPNAPGIDAGLRKIAEGKGPNAGFARTILNERTKYYEADAAITKDQNLIRDLQRGFTTDADFLNKPKKPKTPPKGPADRTEQRFETFSREMDGLQDRYLQLISQITTDVNERAKIEHDRVDADVENYKQVIESRVKQKEITAEQGRQLIAQREANAVREHTVINWRLDDELAAAELDAKRDSIDVQRQELQDRLASARTQAERRAIQLQLLDLDLQEKRARLNLIVDLHSSNPDEIQRAQDSIDRLGADRERGAAAIARSTMSPWERFLDSLPRSAAEVDEAFGDAAASGINDFNRGLAEAIVNGKSFGDVFDNVKRRFLADLIEMELRWAESQLFGMGGGGMFGGGLFGGILGLFGLGGGGAAKGLTGIGSLGGGIAAAFGGGRAGGGPVAPGRFYAVNERSTAPGLFMPLSPGIIEPAPTGYERFGPATSVRGGDYYDLRNSYVTDDLWDKVQQISAANVRDGIGAYDRVVSDRVQDQLARRG